MATPYSARPEALAKPVPGKDEEAIIAEIMAEFEPPKAQAAEPSPSPNVDQVESAAPAEPIQEPGFAPEPGFVQANLQQFNDFTTRIQAGLAANDNEKLGLLRKKYGDKNVLVKNGDIHYRRGQGEKFKRLDPAAFEVVADLIPDFAREIVTEAAMIPGEVAGGAAGSAIAGPGGTVPGVIAGRVASVPAANKAADLIAEAAGVPQDESRSRTLENVVGMGAEAVLPVVGAKVVGAVAKKIPGTLAYKAAKEAGERETVALTRQSNEVLDAIERLSEQGRAAQIDGAAVGIPGTTVPIPGQMINTRSPQLKALAQMAKTDVRYINAEQQVAEAWGSLAENTLTEIGRRSNAGPYSPETLASKVTNAVIETRNAEGKAIAEFKKKAEKNIGDRRLALPQETIQQTVTLMRELGFTPRTRRVTTMRRTPVPGSAEFPSVPVYSKPSQSAVTIWIPPKDINKQIGKMGLNSEGEVRSVVNALAEMSRGVDRGMKIGDLDRMRNRVGDLSDSLGGTPAATQMAKMAKDLRETYSTNISNNLDGRFEKHAFLDAMKEYSDLMGNIKTLKKALNEDASSAAIINKFFKGGENLAKIKAIKAISPESFEALREGFTKKLLIDAASSTNLTGLNSSKLLDKITKEYGDDVMNEVFGGGKGANLQTVKDLLTVTRRIEEVSGTGKVGAEDIKADKVGALKDALIGLMFKIKFKTVNGLGVLFGRGDQSAVMDLLTRDGVAKHVSRFKAPDAERVRVTKQLEQLLAEYKVSQAVKRMSGPAKQAMEKAAPAAKRAGKRALIDNVIKPKQEFGPDVNIEPQQEEQ